MIIGESTKLLVRFKCNGNILLRMSSRLPSAYCAYNNATVVRLISGENDDNRRRKAITRNCQLYPNLSLNRNSVGCVNNAFSMKSVLCHKSHVSSIRQYTDLSHVQVVNMSPFANPAARWIAESPGVEFLIDQLSWIHSTTGMPWWTIIVGIGVVARMTVFPLVVLQQRNVAKLQNLKAELETIQNQAHLKIMDEIEMNRLRHDTAQIMFRKSMKEEYNKLIVRENCHPLRGHVATLLQLPLWISVTFAIRDMTCMAPKFDEAALQIFDELSVAKFLWITNFIQYDPYYVLPILLGTINLTNLEVHSMIVPEQYITKTAKYLRIFSRVIIIGVVPLISHMPSSIVLYWITSSFCAATQNLLLLSPKVRRLLKIRHTETELEKPYSYLLERIRSSLRFKKPPSGNSPSRARP